LLFCPLTPSSLIPALAPSANAALHLWYAEQYDFGRFCHS